MLQLLIGALIVAALSLFLFVTTSNTTSETVETVGETSIVFNSRLLISNMHEVSYFTEYGKNLDMAEAIAYGCKYGEPESGFSYSLSDPVGLSVNTESFLEAYLSQLGGEFYLEVECEEGDNIEVGEEPPEDVEEVTSVQTHIPAINEGKLRANLQRW